MHEQERVARVACVDCVDGVGGDCSVDGVERVERGGRSRVVVVFATGVITRSGQEQEQEVKFTEVITCDLVFVSGISGHYDFDCAGRAVKMDTVIKLQTPPPPIR